MISYRSKQIINVLKCICCIGVVLVHTLFKSINIGKSNLVLDGWGWISFVDISNIISRTIVPVFFLISGYLMFLNYRNYSLQWFVAKIKTRIRTLLLPYLIGIIVYYLFFNLGNIFMSGIMSAGSSHNYNILTMFWYPLPNAVLWFLRDLMVVVLLSPIVIKIVNIQKWLILPVIFVLWFTDIWRFQIPGFSSISFLFFYTGVFLSIAKIDFIEKIHSFKPLNKYLICTLFLTVVLCAFYLKSEYLTKLSIIAGIPTIIILSDKICAFERLQSFDFNFWMPASFFIYVYHVMVEVTIKKTIFALIIPQSAF